MRKIGNLLPRKYLSYRQSVLCLCIMMFAAATVVAQADTVKKFDHRYYQNYPDRITTRIFLSRKYSSPVLLSTGKDIRYSPNTKLNLGVGATYGWFTLNLAYGFDFLNEGEQSKGDTRYLDLQTHVYARKWSIDLLGQFYKGFYLNPKGEAMPNGGWYTRPDLKVEHMGVVAYHIMNWKKFSYRAVLLQNEWQRKSAGSLLLGAEIHRGNIRADSAIVPAVIAANSSLKGTDKVKYTTIGPGVGYTYTFVLHEHFYLSGSVTGTLSLNLTKRWNEDDVVVKASLQSGWFYRAGIGYNSSRANISLSWVNNDFHTRFEGGRYLLRTGNFRFNIAYRFAAGPCLLRQLRILSMNN